MASDRYVVGSAHPIDVASHGNSINFGDVLLFDGEWQNLAHWGYQKIILGQKLGKLRKALTLQSLRLCNFQCSQISTKLQVPPHRILERVFVIRV